VLAFGIFYANQLISIPFNEQNVGLPNSVGTKQEIAEQTGGIIPAVDLASIKNPSPEMIAKGKELYDSNCQSCHGGTGLGDGPAGAALNPKARNLHQTDGWTNGRTIDALYKTLQEGIIQNGMAAYEYLAPSDRLDLIHYIRTFASYPEITDEQINEMNQAYRLTEGTVKANTIPLVKATNLVIEENKSLETRIINAKQRLEQLQSTKGGASLLLSNSFDVGKVLRTFYSNTGISLEKYIHSVSVSPLLSGYRPSVKYLTQEEWKAIFDILREQ
jgi:mono/diheme cytochrome c family protein